MHSSAQSGWNKLAIFKVVWEHEERGRGVHGIRNVGKRRKREEPTGMSKRLVNSLHLFHLTKPSRSSLCLRRITHRRLRVRANSDSSRARYQGEVVTTEVGKEYWFLLDKGRIEGCK